jgi:hypothetical protein
VHDCAAFEVSQAGKVMTKAKKEPFVIRSGNETIVFHATPREAARKIVRETRGTFDHRKRHYEQPEGAHEGRVSTLMDPYDTVLMRCRPSIYSARGKHGGRTHAKCAITPEFSKRLRKRRRR